MTADSFESKNSVAAPGINEEVASCASFQKGKKGLGHGRPFDLRT